MKEKITCWSCAWEIKQLTPGLKLPFKRWAMDVWGTCYWTIMNYSKDFDQKLIFRAISSAFAERNKRITPNMFIFTTDPKLAYTKIYFKTNKDTDIPQKFWDTTLAYAYSPFEQDVQWDIFVNDDFNRAFSYLTRWKYWLKKVMVHEIWHVLNLNHSEDKLDIMYFQNIPDWRIRITDDTVKWLKELYPEITYKI